MSLSLEILNKKKKAAEERIRANRKKIDSIEESYESLRLFKGVVQRSQDDFSSAAGRKDTLLAELANYKDVNNCAKIYRTKLKHYLNNVGLKVVGGAYTGMIGLINIQLKKYYDQVEDLNEKILKDQNLVDDIVAEIDAQDEE